MAIGIDWNWLLSASGFQGLACMSDKEKEYLDIISKLVDMNKRVSISHHRLLHFCCQYEFAFPLKLRAIFHIRRIDCSRLINDNGAKLKEILERLQDLNK